MRWFYTISALFVALLVGSPFLLLSDQGTGKRRSGEALWTTYGNEIKSIDPATCGDVSSSGIQANIYEGLYDYHYLKRPLEVVCVLADSLPAVSEDGLTYTIRLKKGVTYHRNPCFGSDPSSETGWATRQVTSEDFILSMRRVADYHINTGLAWAFLAGRIEGLDEYRAQTKLYSAGDFSRYDLPVAGLATPDSHTIRITLSEPFPQLVYVLAMHVYAPIPRELIDYWLATTDDGAGGRTEVPLHERSVEIMDPRQVVGTGPYMLHTFKRKWEIRLARNPEYRPDYYPTEGEKGDAEAGLLRDAGKRVPFINEVHYRYIAETYPNWMLFLTGQTQASGIPMEAYEAVVTPTNELAQEWSKRGIALRKYEDPSIFWLAFNMEDPILGASKSLRQAICLGFDVETHIEVLFNGRGVRPVNIIPSSFKGHAEAGPGPYFRYDLPAAKEKLTEARQELAARGLLEGGAIPPLTLDLTKGVSATRTYDFMRQQFRALGLELKVQFHDWPTLQRRVHNKQAQMYLMGWLADYPDAENFLQLFYTENIDKGTNNCNYSNREFDSLYQVIRVMQDTPERTEIYARLTRIVSDDCPLLPRIAGETYILYYESKMLNWKPHPIGNGYIKYRRLAPETAAAGQGQGSRG